MVSNSIYLERIANNVDLLHTDVGKINSKVSAIEEHINNQNGRVDDLEDDVEKVWKEVTFNSKLRYAIFAVLLLGNAGLTLYLNNGGGFIGP